MAELQIALPELTATQNLARRLADGVPLPMTLALSGTLGAGKTQFVRYFVEACGGDPSAVTSPTYVLLQTYRCPIGPLFHLDFYRLESAEEAWDLGLDELVEQPAVVLIEWADKFPECLPPDHLQIRIEIDTDCRRASLVAEGPRATSWLRKIEK